MKRILTAIIAIFLLAGSLGCSQPLTTREKGAIGGTAVGAGLGAIIGSATGHAGAGAGIGAAIGLLGGALIGDRMQSQAASEAVKPRRRDGSNSNRSNWSDRGESWND